MPDGCPLTLAGRADSKWRERIGNAVPPPSVRAVGEVILRALLLSRVDAWELSATGIWDFLQHFLQVRLQNQCPKQTIT